MVAPPEEEVEDEGEKMFRTILEDEIHEEEEEEEEEEDIALNNNNNDAKNNNDNIEAKTQDTDQDCEQSAFIKGTVADTNLVPSPLQNTRVLECR